MIAIRLKKQKERERDPKLVKVTKEKRVNFFLVLL